MTEKYWAAARYVDELDQRDHYIDNRIKKPKHVSSHNGTGYRVKFPNCPNKYFTRGTKEENLAAAIEYARQICPPEDFDRVFAGLNVQRPN